MLSSDNQIRAPAPRGDSASSVDDASKGNKARPHSRKDFKQLMEHEKRPLAEDVGAQNAKTKQNVASRSETRPVAKEGKPPAKSASKKASSTEPKKTDMEEKAGEIENEDLETEEPISDEALAAQEAQEADEATPTPPLKKMNLPLQTIAKKPIPQAAEPKESPLAVYKQMTAKGNVRAFARDVQAETPSSVAKADKADKTLKKEKSTARFSETQGDLNGVNPLAGVMGSVASVGGTVEEAKPSVNVSHIQEIVDQIVDRLYTIQTQGQTDTVIVLKQPPLFAGANVVITSFDSASKEFNLSFENLRSDAKRVLDVNLISLRTALEEKGYANAVHIVTTTTYVEHNIPFEGEGQTYARDQEGRQGGGGQSSDEERKEDQEA